MSEGKHGQPQASFFRCKRVPISFFRWLKLDRAEVQRGQLSREFSCPDEGISIIQDKLRNKIQGLTALQPKDYPAYLPPYPTSSRHKYISSRPNIKKLPTTTGVFRNFSDGQTNKNKQWSGFEVPGSKELLYYPLDVIILNMFDRFNISYCLLSSFHLSCQTAGIGPGEISCS
jgi:hypothetical protein